jgi:hypothetical protein
MMELRGEIEKRLTPFVLDKIRTATKPTKVSEVVVVTRELVGMSVSLEEVAEIINVAEPGRDSKAKGKDYSVVELDKHPDLIVTTTPRGAFVRFVGGRTLYSQ